MTDKPAAPATPLTDAAAIAPSHRETALQYVPADFARRLETLCRQQHEALEQTKAWNKWLNCGDEALAAYAALEKEIEK